MPRGADGRGVDSVKVEAGSAESLLDDAPAGAGELARETEAFVDGTCDSRAGVAPDGEPGEDAGCCGRREILSRMEGRLCGSDGLLVTSA